MKTVSTFVLVLVCLIFVGCSANSSPPLTPLATATSGPTLGPETSSSNNSTTLPAATAPATSPQKVTGVASDLLNIRAGPGLDYAVKGQLKQGDTITIIGKSADGIWWQFSGGWVSGTYIEVTGDPTVVPVTTPIPMSLN